jgi:hypothetical protein
VVEDIDPGVLAIRIEGTLLQLLKLCTKRGITSSATARAMLERDLGVSDKLVIDGVWREFEENVARQRRIRPIDARVDDNRPFGLLVRQPREWYPGPSVSGLWGARRADLLRRVSGGALRPEDLRELDESSSCVVGLFGSPSDDSAAVRGLVIGEVQSGKTGHMASVIAKAVDAGFNVVIVLAGLTDVLRNQTQDRLDKDLFVFESSDPTDNSRQLPRCTRWTKKSSPNSPSGGEVNVSSQQIEHDLQRKGWVLAVTKKNVRTINRLCRALEEADASFRAGARVLVIDDEADSASPHAPKKPELSPAGVNQAIRRLLKCFRHHTYVGYTATPYAVVFADPEDPEGFYPRDFIVALPASPSYYGMARIFGSEDDPENDGGLPWALVSVSEEQMSQLKYRKGGPQLSMPPALRDAIQYFVCATAERWRRGQESDSSTMLVHTTPFTTGHRQILALVEAELRRIRDGVEHGTSEVLAGLEAVWSREIARVRQSLGSTVSIGTFADLRPVLQRVLAVMWACQENSVSNERIRFRDDKGRALQQVAVIVGGNVLSRGVTLEGLVVSFFGRATDLYDALSQAGRWFGYRAGYEDLQRIWSTPVMHGFYRDIAAVDRDIRMQVRQLSASSHSPAELPVSVRTHDLLRVTSPYKMWFAENVEVSLDGLRFETTVFDRGLRDESGAYSGRSLHVERQWECARRLFSGIARTLQPRVGADRCSRVFERVPFTAILPFLRDFPLHPADPGAVLRDGLIASYAREIDSDVTFSEWNVALIGVHQSERRGSCELAEGISINRVNRARRKSVPLQADFPDAAFIKQLSSAADVAVDLPAEAIAGKAARNELIALRRVDGPHARPLLAFYAIDRGSRPKDTDSDQYAELSAASDLLGYMLVNPIKRAVRSSARLDGGRLAVKSVVRRPEVEADDELNLEIRAQDQDGRI